MCAGWRSRGRRRCLWRLDLLHLLTAVLGEVLMEVGRGRAGLVARQDGNRGVRLMKRVFQFRVHFDFGVCICSCGGVGSAEPAAKHNSHTSTPPSFPNQRCVLHLQIYRHIPLRVSADVTPPPPHLKSLLNIATVPPTLSHLTPFAHRARLLLHHHTPDSRTQYRAPPPQTCPGHA